MRYILNRVGRGGLVVLSAVAVAGLFAVLALRGPAQAQTQDSQQPMAQANALSKAFRQASEQILPSVVMIKTTTKPQKEERETPRGRSPRGRNPFKGTPFEDFFDGDKDFPGFRSQPFVQQGVGSGVIIDASGIVLTNAHVVEGADEVTVELADGRTVKATDTKTDEQTDLAVVRIKPEPGGKPLQAAKLGDSSKMAIGDWVLAVGNPFELEHTVSAGIISGLKRSLPSGKRAEYFQTDAAINPGNSGGPLVNLAGEVVGINTAIASSSGGYQGIGFAIPSNLAKWVAEQLIKTGSVARAYLGVGIVDITNELAGKLGVGRNEGVVVTEVFPNTPAAKAGFQEGDVITGFAGQKVRSPHELQELVEREPFGSKQKVDVIRDKKPTQLTVEVQQLPKKFGVARTTPKRPERSGATNKTSEALGIEYADLTPELGEQLGLKERSGVVITNVEEDGAAAEAGLRSGMVILRVGRTPVKNAAELTEALKHESIKDGILLLIRTGGGNRLVVVQKR